MTSYYYDFEFWEHAVITDTGRSVRTIEPISFGVCDSMGRERYWVFAEAPLQEAAQKHEWLAENVIVHLKDEARTSKDQIATELLEFFGDKKVDLYGWCSAYDHVCLAWLFGDMIDLPDNIPFYTHDLKSLRAQIDPYKNIELPPSPENEHHALADARWNREVHLKLLPYLVCARNEIEDVLL